jgi:tetraacyldisaccharide 4'-kinase
MYERLTQRWYEAAARPQLLRPLSWLYGTVLGLRRRAYASGWLRSVRAARPVIVVGNLTVGGTGKTPLTLWLAQRLGGGALTVGLLSRGYGRRGTAALQVHADSDWREVGDEPLLLARRSGCPTVVARDRVSGAQLLTELGAQLIRCDDGLQHLRLVRDCEIVVIDGARGFGNRALLPAGPLREPLQRLREVDALVVNGAGVHDSLAQLPPVARFAMELRACEVVPLKPGAPPRELAAWRGQCVHAVAGIGNPARFFAQLRGYGLTVLEHPFPDHHPFSAGELDFADQLPVLMTEKDAVKCAGFANPRLWYVPVVAHFSDADGRELLARLLTKAGMTLPGGPI